MTQTLRTSRQRTIFMDKIRYSMVLAVVVVHGACSFASIIPWWSVRDPVQNQLFDLLIIVLDIFLMPVLYFVAGYFALPSLLRHGVKGFIRVKLKRLGLPLVLLGLFFLPVITYIGHLGRAGESTGFLPYWWRHLPTLFSLEPVLFVDPIVGIRHADDFSQWHLWFITLLLLFFLLLALFCRRLAHGDQAAGQRQPAAPKTIIAQMLTTGFLMTLAMALVNRISPDWAWFKIGALLLIQPTRVPLYAGLFILGALAWHKNWFRIAPLPLKPWIWACTSLVLTLILLAGAKAFMTAPHTPPLGMSLSFAGLRAFACLAYIGWFTTLAQRRLDKATPAYLTLYPSSYDIYLIHLPIVVLLQWGAVRLPLPAGVRFVFISLAACLVSWWLSRHVIQLRPRLAVVLLLAGFLICGIVLP